MRNNSSRGAANVSVTWVFALVILVIAGAAIAAVQMNEATKLAQELEDAKKAKTTSDQGEKKAKDELMALSKVVGFDTEKNPSSVSAIQGKIESMRTTMPDMTSDVKNLDTALRRVTELYRQSEENLAKKESERKRMDAEATQAKITTEQVSKEKQGMIDDLRKQLTDASDRSNAEKSNLEQRITSLQGENKNLDSKMRDAQAQAEKKDSDSRRHIALLTARIQEFQKKMAFLKEPAKTDGQVLSVSEKLDLAYIDLGNKNRLRRGMRFDVLSADMSVPDRKKGVVEVVEVHPDYAEAKIVETRDQYAPIVKGDLLINPVYDPTAERKAVLAGRFSGRLSKAQLGALLKEVGIEVQSNIDITTDYLILGSEEFKDGAPVPYEQMAEVKKAESLGVVIMPLKEIENFFAY